MPSSMPHMAPYGPHTAPYGPPDGPRMAPGAPSRSSICPTAEDKPSSVMTSIRGLRSSTNSRLRWASRALWPWPWKNVENCQSILMTVSPNVPHFGDSSHTRGVRFWNADLTRVTLNSVSIQEDQCAKISNIIKLSAIQDLPTLNQLRSTLAPSSQHVPFPVLQLTIAIAEGCHGQWLAVWQARFKNVLPCHFHNSTVANPQSHAGIDDQQQRFGVEIASALQLREQSFLQAGPGADPTIAQGKHQQTNGMRRVVIHPTRCVRRNGRGQLGIVDAQASAGP